MEQCAITTTDLAEFGSRERQLLIDILIAWREQGLPEDCTLSSEGECEACTIERDENGGEI